MLAEPRNGRLGSDQRVEPGQHRVFARDVRSARRWCSCWSATISTRPPWSTMSCTITRVCSVTVSISTPANSDCSPLRRSTVPFMSSTAPARCWSGRPGATDRRSRCDVSPATVDTSPASDAGLPGQVGHLPGQLLHRPFHVHLLEVEALVAHFPLGVLAHSQRVPHLPLQLPAQGDVDCWRCSLMYGLVAADDDLAGAEDELERFPQDLDVGLGAHQVQRAVGVDVDPVLRPWWSSSSFFPAPSASGGRRSGSAWAWASAWAGRVGVGVGVGAVGGSFGAPSRIQEFATGVCSRIRWLPSLSSMAILFLPLVCSTAMVWLSPVTGLGVAGFGTAPAITGRSGSPSMNVSSTSVPLCRGKCIPWSEPAYGCIIRSQADAFPSLRPLMSNGRITL